MGNFTLVEIVCNISLVTLFVVEIVLFILSFRKNNRSGIPIHLIGIVASLLIALFTISIELNRTLSFESDNVILAALIMAIIFFVSFSIKTLFTERKPKKTPEEIKKVQASIDASVEEKALEEVVENNEN